MDRLWNLNLIHLFDFYLASIFLISIFMRFRQYESFMKLARAVPDRWPRLLLLVRTHHGIFLTWATVLPGFLALGLWIIHTVASRWIWPHAQLTPENLWHLGWALPLGLLVGGAMLGVDFYATFTVGKLDHALLEKYFDQAEYWLRSWVAPVVHIFTFGYLNPRRMVNDEVRKALLQVSKMLNTTLWWVTVQTGLRIAFGLVLWLTWALDRSRSSL